MGSLQSNIRVRRVSSELMAVQYWSAEGVRCDINRLFLQTAIFRLTGLVPSRVIPDCSRWFRPRLFFSWLLLIPDAVDGYCFNKQQHKRQTKGDLKWGISSQRKSVTGMIMLVNVLHKAR